MEEKAADDLTHKNLDAGEGQGEDLTIPFIIFDLP
jgi:hypothetical protein